MTSWNPTRHERREGQVEPLVSPQPKVRMLTYYNQIDGIVLDVLLRKHRQIKSLWYLSACPGDTEAVVEAIFEGLLLRESLAPATKCISPALMSSLPITKRTSTMPGKMPDRAQPHHVRPGSLSPEWTRSKPIWTHPDSSVPSL